VPGRVLLRAPGSAAAAASPFQTKRGADRGSIPEAAGAH